MLGRSVCNTLILMIKKTGRCKDCIANNWGFRQWEIIKILKKRTKSKYSILKKGTLYKI